MKKIYIVGWKEGFKKIQFNYFLQENCSMGLASAKATVDEILDGKEVILEVANASPEVQQKLRSLGLIFKIIAD